jgi:hypothetical protein
MIKGNVLIHNIDAGTNATRQAISLRSFASVGATDCHSIPGKSEINPLDWSRQKEIESYQNVSESLRT